MSKTCWPHIEGTVLGDETALGNRRVTGSKMLASNELSLSLLSRNDANANTIPRSTSLDSNSSGGSLGDTSSLSNSISNNGNGAHQIARGSSGSSSQDNNGGKSPQDNNGGKSPANSVGASTGHANMRSRLMSNKNFGGSFLSSSRDLFPQHQSWPVLKLYCHEGARDLQDIAQFAADVSCHSVFCTPV